MIRVCVCVYLIAAHTVQYSSPFRMNFIPKIFHSIIEQNKRVYDKHARANKTFESTHLTDREVRIKCDGRSCHKGGDVVRLFIYTLKEWGRGAM